MEPRIVRAVRLNVALLATAGLLACAQAPDPTAVLQRPTPRPSASATSGTSPSSRPLKTVAPSASQTSAPTPSSSPPEALERRARVEQDGIRVTVSLDRNPMPAAETTWLTTVVRNVGHRVVTWYVDGCGMDVSVFGTVGARFRSGEATGIPEELADHRAWLLDAIDHGDGTTASIDFLPDTLVNVQDIGCADVGIPRQLHPGEAVRARLGWDGWSRRGQFPPPGGPIELTIRFRHGTGQASTWRTIETSLPAWITNGLDPALLSPAEAVDAALGDAGFAGWLARQPLRDGADTRLRFDAELERWVVGLERYNAVPGWCVARIDARTGEVTAIEGSGGTLNSMPPCPVR